MPRIETDQLTNRELEAFTTYMEGITLREVAEKLDLSTSAVSYRLGHVYRKLGVDNRVSAFRRAIELGILHLP